MSDIQFNETYDEQEIFNPHGVFKGIWVPLCIVGNPFLTPAAKLCYGQLCYYSGKDGKCFPSQQTLSDDLGISKRQIQFLLKELEEKGFIRTINPTGADKLRHLNNTYHFLKHPSLFNENYFRDSEEATQLTKHFATGDEAHFVSGNEANFVPDVREEYKSNGNKVEDTKELRSFESSTLSEPQIGSGLNGGSLDITPTLIRRRKNSTIEFEKIPRQRYNSVVLDVINYWNSSPGILHHKTPPTIDGQLGAPTKTFEEIVGTIGKVLSGNFFNSVGLSKYARVYTKDELISAIDRFKLMATNMNYYPANKDGIRKIGLNVFFYNPFANGVPSYFIKCLEEEPKHITNAVKKEEEKNPQLTTWLREAYIEKVLLGGAPKFNRLEDNKFIIGANILHDKMRFLQRRLNMTTRPQEWCNMVVDCLVDKWGRDKVYVGHVSSNFTYDDTLVRYLKNRGRLD